MKNEKLKMRNMNFKKIFILVCLFLIWKIFVCPVALAAIKGDMTSHEQKDFIAAVVKERQKAKEEYQNTRLNKEPEVLSEPAIVEITPKISLPEAKSNSFINIIIGVLIIVISLFLLIALILWKLKKRG